MTRRMVVTCDRCGADEPTDVLYTLSTAPQSAEATQLTLHFDLCGLCYSNIKVGIAAFATTIGAIVQLPGEDDE